MNNFTYYLKIDTYIQKEFIIKLKNIPYNYICTINLDLLIETSISTYNETHKCYMNPSLDRINNITYSNLYQNIKVNNYRGNIKFEFTMEYPPQENDVIFYYEKYIFKCEKIRSKNQVICSVPLTLFPAYKNISLYSYLSCFNLINVGWFQIVDDDVLNIYDLINYHFNKISEMYDPSEKITEYNEKMINYYYYFSCFSYCDAKTINNKECCPDILKTWELIYSKEYEFDVSIEDFIINLFSIIDSKIQYKSETSLSSDLEALKKFIEKIDIMPEAFTYVDIAFSLASTILYQYNFAILKSSKYKKIVVSFPGITTFLQIIDEIINSGMFEILPFDSLEYFSVLEMFYKTFDRIQEDLFENLKALPEINQQEYQVIFTGHSLGGAVATISSFYYLKKYNFISENILITFGQPRVGSEKFAKYLTNNLKQIYRIARPSDIETLFPLVNMNEFFKMLKYLKAFKGISELIINFYSGDM